MHERVRRGIVIAALTSGLAAQEPEAPKVRPDAVREALRDVVADFWIYDDIARGFTEAKRSGKPLFVSFRCVP